MEVGLLDGKEDGVYSDDGLVEISKICPTLDDFVYVVAPNRVEHVSNAIMFDEDTTKLLDVVTNMTLWCSVTKPHHTCQQHASTTLCLLI